jgi:hypothetical protein
MADKKISALTASSTPLAGTEVLPIVQSGATVKVAVSDLTKGRTVQTTGINDNNNSAVVAVTSTASAVNYLTLANAATNGSPTFTATGTDTNISIVLTPKGSGSVASPYFSTYKASAAVYNTIESDNGQSAFMQYKSFGATWSAGMSWSDASFRFCGAANLASAEYARVMSAGLAVNYAGTPRARLDIAEDTNGNLIARFGAGDNAISNGIYNRSTYISYEFGGYNNASGAKFMSGGTNGVQLANGATSWSTWSDETLKTDLQPITDATQKVKQLRTVTGRFLTDEDTVRRSFFIAQDFLTVFPEVVNQDMPDGKLGLNYTETVPLLAAAINELTDTIEALKAEIAALKA